MSDLIFKEFNKDHVKPGIYNLSNEDYHKGPGVSRSRLMELRRSPLHYWYKHMSQEYVIENDTVAKTLGAALNTILLEPDKFDDQFMLVPKIDKRTKAGAEQWKKIQVELGDKTILTEPQFNELKEMEKSFRRNSLISELVKKANIEPSLYWIESDTGILCKARPDILGATLVGDLKTAYDGSPWTFSKALLDYGYHIQAAMIREGLKAINGIDMKYFWFIVIEKSAPYVVSTYKLDEPALDKGYEEFKRLLALYKHCLDQNDWPGYEMQEVSLPRYAFN